MSLTSTLAEQLKQLPARPGVYLFRDAEGTIIYVGKAVDLRQRVRSYFSPEHGLDPKTRRLVRQVRDVEYYVTRLEQEALILELNLIKQHHPRFNIRLKDDKTFPYLKVSVNEAWPRVYLTRRLEDDGGRYFGPFASARSVRRTLQALKRIFPFRSCSRAITGTDKRACLEYHLNQCIAPCIGAATQPEYAAVIRQVLLFLEGKQEAVRRELESQMAAAAAALQFEKAAIIRDQIAAIDSVVEGQQIAAVTEGNQDAIAFADDGHQACVQVFFVRQGRLIGRESFTLQGTASETPASIMASFIKQYYSSALDIPPRLLLQHPVEDRAAIEEWLSGRRGGRVRLHVPQRGSKRRLVETVAENAAQGLQQMKARALASPATLDAALAELKERLGLAAPPRRLEGYDISNIQGKEAVGSMVVFVQGRPRPKLYRRFRIRTVEGANDYAMLQEMLHRRFKRLRDSGGPPEDTWAEKPDLVLIDGGKGQLNAALEAIEESGTGPVAVASLAKEHEEVFLPGHRGPVELPRGSAGLQLLQRVRDEAHRFAIGYHQKLHRKRSFGSSLDVIPGIGPKRKRALLRRFGSVKGIREAPLEDIAAVAGMSPGLARKVKELL